jgi:hypothetical protein
MSLIRKDIQLLRDVERNFYHEQLQELRDRSHDETLIQQWIYNVPSSLHDSFRKSLWIYVIEMNNDTNEIIGLSCIQNKCYYRRHQIHSDNNYNRYSYIGKRIYFDALSNLSDFKTKLTNILFKGSTHQKRGHGIQKFNDTNINFNEKNIFVRTLEATFEK